MTITPEAAERGAEGEGARRRFPSLYIQVLIAIAFGVLLGWWRPQWGIAMKPLGDGFVKLIKMLIAPIVFTTVAVGIAGMRDLKKAGRVGGKAIVWFEAMTTLALLIGLAVAHIVRPGGGIHASVAKLDTGSLDKTLAGPRPHGLVQHLLAIIPDSFVGAFSALFAGLFSTLNKRTIGTSPALTVTGLEMAAGAAVLPAIVWLLPAGEHIIVRPDLRDGLLLLALSMACTLFPYALALVALRHLSAFDTTLAVNMEPVYAIVLAILLLNEQRDLEPSFYLGVAIIIAIVFSHPWMKRNNVLGS